MTVESVASLVGVSSATVRNWVKAGHLTPTAHKPLLFLEEDALQIKRDIYSGALARLRGRANKSCSQVTRIPKEYATDPSALATIDAVVAVYRREHLDLAATMYFAALRLLELHDEVARNPAGSVHDFQSFHSWKRPVAREELSQWSAGLSWLHDYHSVYFSLNSPREGDFLGLLYQSLCDEGNKSKMGSYYTPSELVRESLEHATFSGNTFLDPCCGTGTYLLYAAKILRLGPEQLYGFDIDDLAARIARINLLLAFPSYQATPNVRCLNALSELATGELFCTTNHLLENIDFIATNPPWGAYKNFPVGVRHSLELKSNEAFGLFLAKSLTLLKEGGILSFVLPASILNIRSHSDIRYLILENAKIVRIWELGRQFSGVFTTAVKLDLIKGKPDPEWLVSIRDGDGNTFQVKQARFMRNEHYTFDVNVRAHEDYIIQKIYSIDHVTLEENAEWALGIVTGNNKMHLSDTAQEGMEPIVRGCDISPFRLRGAQSFIRFDPNAFQQVAKGSLYRAPEKLIYRFISNSLVFAYDDQQRLTLNSANILIPHIPGLSIKVVLAFLNSQVFQYLFKKKCATHKVLRSDLEKLPFPKLSVTMSSEIEANVDAIHAREGDFEKLENLLFSAFCLSDKDVQVIRDTLEDDDGAA